MSWNNKDYILWSLAFFFAVADLITTHVGIQHPKLREANLFVNNFSGAEFWIFMVLLKILALALGIFFYQYFDFDNRWFIPAILGIVWAIVSLNNLILVLLVV